MGGRAQRAFAEPRREKKRTRSLTLLKDSDSRELRMGRARRGTSCPRVDNITNFNRNHLFSEDMPLFPSHTRPSLAVVTRGGGGGGGEGGRRLAGSVEGRAKNGGGALSGDAAGSGFLRSRISHYPNFAPKPVPEAVFILYYNLALKSRHYTRIPDF